MNRIRKCMAAAAVGALAIGLVVGNTGVASADPAPGANDVVGVGSDTLQYMLDFGADGDYNGVAGYNSGKQQHLISFDATADANARAAYLNGSTDASLRALNPTIVLRSGTAPVQRPNGSGAGIAALATDLSREINFARSSSALSAGNIATATGTGGVGALHEIRLATDALAIATATTTNAPALTTAQLKAIYLCQAGATTWNGSVIGGTSTATIIPVIPQSGSGTRKTFLTDIGFTTDSSGNVTQAVGSCVKTGEENDPYALYVDASGNPLADPYATSAVASPNAIEPMSGGRLTLFQNGYFQNPNVAYGATPPSGDVATLKPGVKLTTSGSPIGGGTVYDDVRGLYVDFRDADVNSSSTFNGGLNWVKTLFYNPGSTGAAQPFFQKAAGQALLASAGVTPAYADCGVDVAGAGACS